MDQPSQKDKIPRVVVAMSGGVDSSVAAALLVQQGYEVIGIMMRLWNEPGTRSANRCCTPEAMAMARRVAAHLGIPFYVVDTQEVFHRQVVKYFLDGYAQGITPNPCLVCNRRVRWEFLLHHALALEAQYLATGHYARIRRDEAGKLRILRAIDESKDQSYVLHVLGQQQLQHALFPIGDFPKSTVRQMAQEFSLPVAERAESQDLCFLGNSDYRDFLMRHIPEVNNPGPILNRTGKQIGTHKGLAFYTIGQRKGLNLNSPTPLYVVDKDPKQNILFVSPKSELGRSELTATNVNWVSGEPLTSLHRLQVKIRYRAHDAWAIVIPLDEDRIRAVFDQPLRDITPGQAAVFYDGVVCIGGGIIQMEENPS